MRTPPWNRKPLVFLMVLFCATYWTSPLAAETPTTRLTIAVTDVGGQPLPCRVHLIDQHGDAQNVSGQPFWHDHFVCPGTCIASLALGKYDYAIERGPEYLRRTGQIEITDGDDRTLDVKLERIANLRAAGWYSGDLHVHRPVAEIEQLMRAENLDVAPVITWWNSRNMWKRRVIPNKVTHRFDSDRFYTIMAGEDEREGGALLYFGLKSPLDIETDDREFPSPMQFVAEAKKRDREVWIDIEKPFWWDVPVWLASGQMNSIGIANNHMCRSQMYPSEAWGKPRDAKRLPEPRGNGFWSQEIYYHMLNCGLRIPPSAGSASGVLPNPVGYNRVYVHLEEPFTRDAWFRGLSRGRCFVTNGPLLLVKADGHDPGTSIKLTSGENRPLHIDIQLTSQDPVPYIELIENGIVAHTIKCSSELTERNTFTFSVDEPGWFLIRAIADVEGTFRFATTAPWFVEADDVKHRISRTSVQFFCDWVNERIERVKANIKNDAQREQVLVWHTKAREFWTERLRMANAE
ncbi:MAG: CehA/McbA family metallohydrolase [Planctomycetes bacterium]|nr:CehA/McbA family metallohydrolase [Planctomycetota bacterium]